MKTPCPLAVLFVSILVSFSPAAQARSDESYLVIKRSAQFGSVQWLKIWIDGKKVDAVAWGHHYRGPISPGHHVIAADLSSERWQTPPKSIEINVEPGRTYQFVAIRHHNDVDLRRAP